LLILIDTLRADHMSLYGYARETTPFIDRLGARGAVFEQARAQASCTFPSVNSILSGRHPAIYHGQPDGRQGFLPGVPTLQETLRAAGYRTVAVSSSTVVRKNPGPHNLGGGFDTGFDEFDERCLFRRSGCIAEAALEILDRPAIDPATADVAHSTAASAAPFFLYAHFLDPHSPYDPPARFEGRYAARDARGLVRGFIRRGDLGRVRTFLRDGGDVIDLSEAEKAHVIGLYDEDILSADDGVRVLVEAIARRGRRGGSAARDTLVVLVADHGEEFYDHGGIYHCSTTFDELVRTPLLFAGAGVAPARVGAAVQNVDVMPTILDWVGVALPRESLDGVSRAANLRASSPASSAASEERAFSAQHVWRSITDGTWKLVLDVKERRGMLYHLPSDPAELRDVASEHRREFRRLYDDLVAHLEATEGGVGSAKSQEAMDESLRQLKALGYL
jgi:arylsulfatase